MKKTHTKKLVLSKQSIRALTSEEAAGAAGGFSGGFYNTGMGSSAEAIVTPVPRIPMP